MFIEMSCVIQIIYVMQLVISTVFNVTETNWEIIKPRPFVIKYSWFHPPNFKKIACLPE